MLSERSYLSGGASHLLKAILSLAFEEHVLVIRVVDGVKRRFNLRQNVLVVFGFHFKLLGKWSVTALVWFLLLS